MIMTEYRVKFRVTGCSYHRDEYDTATFHSFRDVVNFLEPLDCSDVRWTAKKKGN